MDGKLCTKDYGTVKDRGRHRATAKEHGGTGEPCVLCPESYSRNDARLRHMTTVHAVELPRALAQMCNGCPICGRGGLGTDSLARHLGDAHKMSALAKAAVERMEISAGL